MICSMISHSQKALSGYRHIVGMHIVVTVRWQKRDDATREQLHRPVKSTAGGVIPAGQVPVNPVIALLRHDKPISLESLCNLDTYWLLTSLPSLRKSYTSLWSREHTNPTPSHQPLLVRRQDNAQGSFMLAGCVFTVYGKQRVPFFTLWQYLRLRVTIVVFEEHKLHILVWQRRHSPLQGQVSTGNKAICSRLRDLLSRVDIFRRAWIYSNA